MSSLRELQERMAQALAGPSPASAAWPAERIAIYRRNIAANYRNALAASYPVVRRLTGAAFFGAAVDAYVVAHPSRSGDLNVYGDAFGDFLVQYAPATHGANWSSEYAGLRSNSRSAAGMTEMLERAMSIV